MAPLKVGLTGGIGCGKSTISRQFASLGVPVIDADHVARDVVAAGQPVLLTLKQHFGAHILNVDGSLNREVLRKIIFQKSPQRTYVEELLHPLILQQIQNQLEEIQSPYVIIEIPLLIEAGWQPFVDQILVVDVPEDLQLNRLMLRSELGKHSLEQIIKSQISRNQRNQYADTLIDNSGTPNEIFQQVSELHRHYLQLAQRRDE